LSNNLSIVALIPARSGSKRVIGKNIKRLNGHPLIAYTISAAINSKVFTDIIVSTDSEEYAEIAKYYGASVPFLRPSEYASENSPDIEWVSFTLQRLKQMGKNYSHFSILRPTSPFRKAETIKRAYKLFIKSENADSIRAIEDCSQHPAKMWSLQSDSMSPILIGENNGVPWHSCQKNSLPKIFVQNASLEIANTKVVFENNSISGERIIPFITQDYEGYDINRPKDWIYAEYLCNKTPLLLSQINKKPYTSKNVSNNS